MLQPALVCVAEMSPQAHLSPEEVDNIRNKVSLHKHNVIPMQRTCGYKGINRTTLADILYHLKRFRFPIDAIRDLENRLSLQSTIRSIAASAIRWDIDRGNTPTWTDCTHTQKARMLHELEERYPWMKQFHGQWVAIVLMGKHVSSKSRDMQKALKLRQTAQGTLSPISRPMSGLSPIVISGSSSSPSASGSIDGESEYGEEEIGHAHDNDQVSTEEGDIGEKINEESDTGEETYRDHGIDQDYDDDQPQIPSLLLKSRPAKNVVRQANHSKRTRSPLVESPTTTNEHIPDKILRVRAAQDMTPTTTTDKDTFARYKPKTSIINKGVKRKLPELDKSTSADSNAVSKSRTFRKPNNHPISGANSEIQLTDERNPLQQQPVKDRGKARPTYVLRPPLH
jgi:hypothetical protein